MPSWAEKVTRLLGPAFLHRLPGLPGPGVLISILALIVALLAPQFETVFFTRLAAPCCEDCPVGTCILISWQCPASDWLSRNICELE